MAIENTANETRAVAANLRIKIEGLRDEYWGRIDRSDNDSMEAEMTIVKRLNEAIGEVDATLNAIELALELMEEYLEQRAKAGDQREGLFDDQTDEDQQDALEMEPRFAAAALEVGIATPPQPDLEAELDDDEREFERRIVTHSKARVTDVRSHLPEHTWLSLKNDFTHTKPTVLRSEGKEFSGLSSWKGLYNRFLREAYRRDPERFAALVSHSFPGVRRPIFTKNGGVLISPVRVGGLYAETNFSAKSTARLITLLGEEFGSFGEMEVQIRKVEKTTED